MVMNLPYSVQYERDHGTSNLCRQNEPVQAVENDSVATSKMPGRAGGRKYLRLANYLTIRKLNFVTLCK